MIKVKTPAKINLTLEVLNKRNDGFHNIQSIMQAINLYDFLTIDIETQNSTQIILNGNSTQIPYDEKNIVYKATKLFLDEVKISNKKISVYIEKNIPVEAGLAGGSTNASGIIFALNKYFDNLLTDKKINELLAKLGSDLNFCYYGGTALCTGRGENIEKLPFLDLNLSLIKPKNFGISTKIAYQKVSEDKKRSFLDNTDKLKNLILQGTFNNSLIFNSFEEVLVKHYPILKNIKNNQKSSYMSGSGPTFFVLNNTINDDFKTDEFIIFENLNTIKTGVEIC